MIERLDQQLFLFLNSINSPFWDNIMFALSGRLIWAPLYLVILFVLWKKLKRKMLILIPVIIVAVALCDQISVHLFKEVFQRLRPCHEPSLEGMIHLVRGQCGGQYGFVSSHATNSFNVALLSLLFIRKRWFTIAILLWAALVSYSRIYLGVHYPGDVLCGALLGSAIGYATWFTYNYIDREYLIHKKYFDLSGQQ
jgi:undecaprenyl-diphosphatase